MESEIIYYALGVVTSPFIGSLILTIFAFIHYAKTHGHEETEENNHEEHEEHGLKYTPLENFVSTIGILSIFASWVFMLLLAIKFFTTEHHGAFLTTSYDFFGFPVTQNIQVGLLVDALSVYMGLIVTTLALLIHMYAREYMHGDKGYPRFFATFNFFTGIMLSLVFSSSFFELFIFWELVGLSSYLLIGFWIFKPSAAHAAKKAFLYNKVGDVALLSGFLILYKLTGTLNFMELPDKIHNLTPLQTALISVLIFGGVIGKSAQFPLYTWLADAMEGPTPVSAILHSSTMVKAGVYMVARVFFLYWQAHEGEYNFAGDNWALAVVAWVAAITALLAGLQALVENEIKRILAYSTVSQISYMVLALGAGSKTAAMYHLLSHATFKALLFLTAGAVIHVVHTNNIWEMGNLRKKIPKTFTAMLIGAIGLSGFPGISGFWSKDAVLATVYYSDVPGNKILFTLGVVTAFITALYTTRFIIVVFFREPTPENIERVEHAHDGGFFLTIPPLIMAALVILESLTFIPTPIFKFEEWLMEWLEPGVHAHEVALTLPILSAIVVLLGIGTGIYLYYYNYNILASLNQNKVIIPIREFIAQRYYIDKVLYWIANVPAMIVSRLLQDIDIKIIDRTIIDTWIVKGSLGLAKISDVFDQGIIDGIVNGVWMIALTLGRAFRKLQTGIVSNYASIFAAALVIFLGYVNFLIFIK